MVLFSINLLYHTSNVVMNCRFFHLQSSPVFFDIFIGTEPSGVFPPHLHLTTSKVMVIVWRLRWNIIWTVLYWQRATSSMGTVNRNSSHSPVGPWVCLSVFWVAWFIFMFMCVLFYLGQLSHFLSCFGAGVTDLNEPPSSFLLLPHYCGLGAGSIPFRAIVNQKQCEMRGLFISLVIHYWIGDVQDCQSVSASEMTYIVSSGALNSTHSLWSVYIVHGTSCSDTRLAVFQIDTNIVFLYYFVAHVEHRLIRIYKLNL